MTPQQIRTRYIEKNHGHFFDKESMAFFGDTMQSYKTATVDGQHYMHSNPLKTVSVFGRVVISGQKYFRAWLVDADGDLSSCNNEVKNEIYGKVYGQNNMNEYLTKYDYVILKRLSTDSTLRIKTPRTIHKNETSAGVPSDIWDWLCLEFGEYNGNFVFFQYAG